MNDNNSSPIASCTGRINVIKDGKDGIGIESADVVFAVYTDYQNAPADNYSGWKTTFGELVLIPGCYVWTATKMTNTDSKTWLTGKRCLGSCTDFASIKEMYALGDSSTEAPGDGLWQYTYTAEKGKWLWTKNELTYQGKDEKVYTDPVCIGYFSKDGINGTSFTPKGTAYAHFANHAAFEASDVIIQDGDILLDTITDKDASITGPVKISFDELITGNEVVSKADDGDAYRIGTDLWVSNGSEWVDFGDIQGAQGESGKDAPWAVFTNNPVSFETDKDGCMVSAEKSVDIVVYLGTSIITSLCTFQIESGSAVNFDTTKITKPTTGNATATVVVPSAGVKTKTVTVGSDTYTVPCPNSSFIVKITYEDYEIRVTVNIVTDTTLQDGYFRSSVEGLKAQYVTIESTVSGNTATLTTHQSLIEANSKAITTKVSQTDFDEQDKEYESRFSSIEQTANGIKTTVSQQNAANEERFSSIEQNAENISLSVTNTKDEITGGLKKSGIDIDSQSITLNSEKVTIQTSDGNEVALFDKNGLNANLIKAGKLETANANGASVVIEDGMIKILGTNGVCNIAFGVNDDGVAVLSYYDKDGNWLYDLGPSQIDASKQSSSEMASASYVLADTYPGSADFSSTKDYTVNGETFSLDVVKTAYAAKLFGTKMYADDNEEISKNPHTGYQPFTKQSAVTLYTYKAAKLNNTYVKDDKYNLSALLAEEANGKTFTSTNICNGTKLINLASGKYFDKSASVRMAPIPAISAESSGNTKYPAYNLPYKVYVDGVMTNKTVYSTIEQTVSAIS